MLKSSLPLTAAGFFVAEEKFVKRWLPFIILLLLFWGTRLVALDLLPLHNDEGLHLTRAVEVWRLHPFWAISDGKIINHWLIALFYPQHAPVFVGRFATLLVSALGMAAAYAVARRLSGLSGAVLAAALWMGCTYLFFFERLAFSDSQAGALALAAVWAALHTAETKTQQTRWAILTGVLLAAAMLFKFTAAPYALAVALVIGFAGKNSLRGRATSLIVIGVVVAACFAIPVVYLLLRGEDFFGVALGWIGGGAASGEPSFIANLRQLGTQLTGYGSWLWVIAMLVGLASLAVMQRGRLLLLAGLLPLVIIMLLGREVLARHFVVVLPLLLALGGAGLGWLLSSRPIQRFGPGFDLALVIVVTIGAAFPFMLTAYSDPAALPLPPDARYEHISSHSAGFGLAEAVTALPQTMERPELPIIASMFPDSCRRANFYATTELKLTCTDAPGADEIAAALEEFGAVYVLADNAPLIGVDVTTLDGEAELIGAYPRPGEATGAESVKLWLIQH